MGLWLPAQAASQLATGAEDFRKFLSDRRLRPFTINGFPYDNFHQPVVKHRVYKPTWWQQERLDYTKQLADVLAVLLPESQAGWFDQHLADRLAQRGRVTGSARPGRRESP